MVGRESNRLAGREEKIQRKSVKFGRKREQKRRKYGKRRD
jgi:hypothetical protein